MPSGKNSQSKGEEPTIQGEKKFIHVLEWFVYFEGFVLIDFGPEKEKMRGKAMGTEGNLARIRKVNE